MSDSGWLWNGKVMIRGLRNRTDLNSMEALVLPRIAYPRRGKGERIPVEVSIPSKERIWIHPGNLCRVGEDGFATLPNGTRVMPTIIVASEHDEAHQMRRACGPLGLKGDRPPHQPSTNVYNDNREPPPVRRMTPTEALAPGPKVCEGLCPKYPKCTAARLVAYMLNKVDYVTPGVQADYDIKTASGWYFTRERLIKLLDAGEENAAEVLHEEFLVNHHTKNNTPAEFLPAEFEAIRGRVAARQQKDKGAEPPAPAPAPNEPANLFQDMYESVEAPAPAPDPVRSTKAWQAVARKGSIEKDRVFACPRCDAHRPMGYRCCGMYMGLNGEKSVPRRNVHAHPHADEDEVDDFLAATLARLDRERAEGVTA